MRKRTELLAIRNPIRITLTGVPQERGDFEAVMNPRNGKPQVREVMTAAMVGWRKDASVQAERQLGWQGPFRGPVAVRMFFTVHRPLTEPGASREYPHYGQKLELLEEALMLAMRGVAWTRPAQVIDLHSRKAYVSPFGPTRHRDVTHEPGAVLHVRALP